MIFCESYSYLPKSLTKIWFAFYNGTASHHFDSLEALNLLIEMHGFLKCFK